LFDPTSSSRKQKSLDRFRLAMLAAIIIESIIKLHAKKYSDNYWTDSSVSPLQQSSSAAAYIKSGKLLG